MGAGVQTLKSRIKRRRALVDIARSAFDFLGGRVAACRAGLRELGLWRWLLAKATGPEVNGNDDQ